MAYIGRSTDGFGVRDRFVYVVSGGATSVSGVDANGAVLKFSDGKYVDVYLNGVLLKPTTDYNTNTANTISGISSMAASDEVTVIVYDIFAVADTVSATQGGTFSGNVELVSTDAGTSGDPTLTLYRNSASPADGDYTGEIIGKGRNDNSQDVQYSKISTKIVDVSDGTEDGNLEFYVRSNGNQGSRLFLKGNGRTAFVNKDLELGTGVDLVFEGSTADANETILTVTDPTADRTITLPNATGTVITTGNTSDLTTVGTLTSLAVTGSGGDYISTFQNSTAGTPYGVYIKEPSGASAGYPLLNIANHDGSATRFRVDSSTGHVGIGAPPVAGDTLHIKDTAPSIMLEETSSGGSKRIAMAVSASGTPMLSAAQSGGLIDIYLTGSHTARFHSGGFIVQHDDSSAELKLNASYSSGSGTPQLTMYRSNTLYGMIEASVNSAANGLGNHCVIVAPQGDLYAKDSAGNSTLLSPHKFEYIPDGASETGAWAYKSDKFVSDIEKDEEGNKISEKVKSGTYISADMTKVIRQVEKLTGEKLIYKGTLDVNEDGEVSKHNDDGSTVKDNIIADLIKRIEALENK